MNRRVTSIQQVRSRPRSFGALWRRFTLRWRAQRLLRPFADTFHWLAWSPRFFDWMDAHRDESTVLFDDRSELHEYCLTSRGLADTPIDYLEFGVAAGESLRWWTSLNTHLDSRFHGFDTFTGIPEAWVKFPAGSFSSDARPPDIADPRIEYHVGLFQETLTPFLANFQRTRPVVVHLDADLYSSTLYVLTNVGPITQPGDLFLFDEAGAVIGITHEFRALADYSSAFQKRFRLIGGAFDYVQLALEVI
jgi:hypothetical protein